MMRRTPSNVYRGVPCSVVAVGCAMGITARERLKALYSPSLHSDGYLSLDGMNKLIRANISVIRQRKYKRGARPCLRDFCHSFSGRAVVCVVGHFVYVENGDYWSFFRNGDDDVISVWELN